MMPVARDSVLSEAFRQEARDRQPSRWAATRPVAWRILWQDLLGGFRLRSIRQRVSGQRALFYTLVGYAFAPDSRADLLVVNTLVIALLFSFFGAYDNYWDWRLLGEENATGAAIQRWGLRRELGLALACAPWLLIVPLILLARGMGWSPASELTLWAMTALGLSYMTPGIRLKGRVLDGLVAPIWACLLFVEAEAVWKPAVPSPSLLVLCAAMLALQGHAEVLHRLDDARRGPNRGAARTLLAWLRRLAVWTAVGALLAAWLVHPIFLNTTLWSLVRLAAVGRLELRRVSRLRRQWWHPVWSLYEFAVYAVGFRFSGLLSAG